jgi:hypothetical protein
MLPISWVDRIFARLSVRYGSAFLRRYEGLDADAVKQDWALMLADYKEKPEPLLHALNNLPDSLPPTAGEFRAIARQHVTQILSLPAPSRRKEDASKAREVLNEYFAMMKRKSLTRSHR